MELRVDDKETGDEESVLDAPDWSDYDDEPPVDGYVGGEGG